jgi:hypothetical protein
MNPAGSAVRAVSHPSLFESQMQRSDLAARNSYPGALRVVVENSTKVLRLDPSVATFFVTRPKVLKSDRAVGTASAGILREVCESLREVCESLRDVCESLRKVPSLCPAVVTFSIAGLRAVVGRL